MDLPHYAISIDVDDPFILRIEHKRKPPCIEFWTYPQLCLNVYLADSLAVALLIHLHYCHLCVLLHQDMFSADLTPLLNFFGWLNWQFNLKRVLGMFRVHQNSVQFA